MDAEVRIYNRTRKRLLASEGRAALSFQTRLRGLLGHRPLHPGQGLWIAPCNWIHTVGMGFPIDVLYLDREGRILQAAPAMHPNRIGPLVWRAKSVVELPVGAIDDSETRAGDYIEVTCTLAGDGMSHE
jgi:uncharacterized membrane protein (UPF0127 family)